MRPGLALLALALLAGCGRRGPDLYKKCLSLRVGMTWDEARAIMGEPGETRPYEEGKSLPHLKGRTVHEWPNSARLPGPNVASVDDATGELLSVRCSDVVISAEVRRDEAAPSEGKRLP